MKTHHLIPILFLAAFCTVSAQTNMATTPALLTTNQAVALAIRLANTPALLTTNQAESLTTPLANAGMNTSDVFSINVGHQTRYADGHWYISFVTANRDYMLRGNVELAPDGSTNSVRVSVTSVHWDTWSGR